MIKNKYIYLIIFTIIYFLGIGICCLFQNIFYMFMFNGFFTVCQTWIIFFIFNKSEKHVKNKQIKHENDNKLIPKIEKEKNIISTHKTVPDETDNVYIGEEISLDDIKRMKEENQSWYSKSHQNINKYILEIKKIMEGEE